MKHIIYYSALLIALSMACNTKPTNTEVPPPNIVWLVSEDNSKHYMKLFDDNGAETPNIASLADHGFIYTRAFSNTPVCSSARSTLISGAYGPRMASHYHRRQKKVPLLDGAEMFPAYLRKAGYYTTNNSKEDYNFIKPDNVWDESSKEASWKNRAEGQPFFHVFNIGTTHESRLHFDKEKMDANPTKTNQETVFVQPNHPNTEIFRYTNAFYRDKIVTMDEEVGEVIDELKKDGLYDNTFIFYYGDHGGVLPGSKGYMYETGLHVPLVVHVPEMYHDMVDADLGGEINGFVSFVDFAPTVLSIAGVAIPEHMDGKAFLGANVITEEVNARDEVFCYADRFDEKYDMLRSIRKGKYKYIRSYQPFNYNGLMNNYRYQQMAFREWKTLYENGELNEIQSQFFEPRDPELLFDVEADPYETNNLAKDASHAETLKLLRESLNTQMKRMPDLSFYPEFYLVNNAFDNPVKFGLEHKADIADYIDVANLGLMEFDAAKGELEKNLKSDDPWKRYWGLNVCSAFGEKASEFETIVREIIESDSEIMNRVRGAEFLGLIKAENPSEAITTALYDSQDGVEALLILNSIVFMRDGHNYPFDLQLDKMSEPVKGNAHVQRRLKYLKVL